MQKNTILVVNDNSLQRQLMRFQLEKEGFRVAEAKDGKEALQCLKNQGKPSLIISDIAMPGINGWELLQLIRNSEDVAIREIPFIAASAFYSHDEADALGRALGATATISIPYSVDFFVEEIKKCLAGKRISQRGTVLFQFEVSNLPDWKRVFEIGGFSVVQDENYHGEPNIVVTDSDSCDAVTLLKKKFPAAILVVLNRSQELTEIDFMQKGANLVFNSSVAPFYVCMLAVRELERKAGEIAQRLLQQRTIDIDRTGINKKIPKDILNKIFFRIDVLGIILIDSGEHSILFANPAARVICAEAGKLDNRNLIEFLKKHYIEKRQEDRLLPVYVNIGKWNNFKTIELVGREFEIEDRRQLLILARDITSEQRNCHETMQTTKMNSILVMAGGIAHNLNNILMGISGFAQLLEEKFRNGDIDQTECTTFVERISISVQKAARLIRKMNKFSRPVAGKAERVLIDDILKDVLYLTKSSMPGIDLSLSIKRTKLPVTVNTSDLEDVLVNIIVNAANSMKRKGEIKITQGAINIHKRLIESGSIGYVFPGFSPVDGMHAFVSIKDMGHGIKQEDLYSIFEPYFTTRINEGGTGLGLAMCYSTIKAFSGFIAVETEIDKGSTFTVYLPLSAPDEKTAEPRERDEDLEEIGKLRSLVIDDDKAVQELIAAFLKHKGAEAVVASDGLEGMELLRQGNFNIVILDLNMPGMDGLEFLKEKQADGDKTPVIIATGKIDPLIEEKCRSLGAAAFMRKPFTLQELADALSTKR